MKQISLAIVVVFTMLIQSVAMAAMHVPSVHASEVMVMDCHDMNGDSADSGKMSHSSPCGQHCAISAGFLPSNVVLHSEVQSPVFGSQILFSPAQADSARLDRPPKV